jgi:NAD(P)-dependent dehydrogenase (short-subunit alcohol dehydrogenase family)
LSCHRRGARAGCRDRAPPRGGGCATDPCRYPRGGRPGRGDELSADLQPVDLRDPASVAALGAGLDGPLHGLVNNGAIATGIGGIGFEDVDIDTWDRVMEVNVRGTWLMTRAAAPALRASGSGRIVNVASDTALWGAPNLMSYVASKGAVISMTRALARELGARRHRRDGHRAGHPDHRKHRIRAPGAP